MPTFKPFANDSQVVTFFSGDHELSLENGTDEIVLAGTLSIPLKDPAARANLQALQAHLGRILAALD